MNNYPTRTASLREAADVLRTYRRAAGGERKAESESQHELPAAIHASWLQKRLGSSKAGERWLEHLKGQEHAGRAEHQRRVAAIPDSTMSKNV